MTSLHEQIRSGDALDWVAHDSQSLRPPSWIPPRDWVTSKNTHNKILSRWGDSVWDISPLAKKSMVLDFGDGPLKSKATKIDRENADTLRALTTWRMWGAKACRTANDLKSTFLTLRRIVSICSANGIQIIHLSKFPLVVDEIINALPQSEFQKTIRELHRLWDNREEIGFSILSPSLIGRFHRACPTREIEQTAYIPPRIWTYQLKRLQECLDDFIKNKQNIEECYRFCLDAYVQNYGSLEAAYRGKKSCALPFWTPEHPGKGSRSNRIYHGPFSLTAQRFELMPLFEKWLEISSNTITVKSLSAYLSLVQRVGLAIIANFTLQRIDEVSSLRKDCLQWELDPKLGRIPIICGETTKTDRDSDARWPTSPSVEPAVKSLALIAEMRMRCVLACPNANPSQKDIDNPYLVNSAREPWIALNSRPYETRVHIDSYRHTYERRFLKLFSMHQLRITEEDLRIAYMFTPNLGEDFVVGKPWPLAWHQLRRTTAINMFASRLVSDSSMQFLMKHTSRSMPLYYGRGYTKLLLNQEVEKIVVNAMYEAMANNVKSAMDSRFVSPYGDSHKNSIIVQLLSEKDTKELAAAGLKGLINFREIQAGACTHRGVCPYGGVESLSRCTGGDGDSPCADVLYDIERTEGIEKEVQLVDEELKNIPRDHPRSKALMMERKGMENFLNVVKK